MAAPSHSNRPLFLDELEVDGTDSIIVMVGRVWDVNATTGRYLSTDFVFSDSKVYRGGGQSLRVTLVWYCDYLLYREKTAFVGMVFQYKLYLSSTSSTVIYDNDDIPSLQELRSVTSLVEPNKEMMMVDCSQSREGTVEPNKEMMMTVTFQCKVMIEDIKRKSGWNYPSCGGEKCRKSVSRQAGNFLCETCNRTVDYPVLRYRLEVVVADDTAHTVVVMFHEIATELLKCFADFLIKAEAEVGFCYLIQPHSYIDTNLHIQFAEDDSCLPTAIRNLIGTTHVMELKSHTYYEYGSYESFKCWKINPTDLVDDDASSSNQLITVNGSEPSFKRLARKPSVCAPSKPNEEKMKKRYTEYTDNYSIFVRFASKIYKDSFKYHYKTVYKQSKDRITPSLSDLVKKSLRIHSNTTIRQDGRVQSYCGLTITEIDAWPFSLRVGRKTLKKAALTSAVVYVIEFQKRGLPHAYILLWLEEHLKCRTPSEIDDIISAELPSLTDDPAGYKVVTEYMLHGPCGKDTREGIDVTMFTDWFELNKCDPAARTHTYADIPKQYVWNE
ncbi:DNA helicase PIF1, ATP-dependent [Tanacetum coccineum]|uniref:DNA helicase PIF1, ATP-dependent n=1 Tax=Tanacetum coccineum TaxID=301880 RepID=A0ABQ5DHE1_9ASTR